MTLVLYHRTTIREAREIVQKGFEDLDWDFGLQDSKTGEDTTVPGVWLSNRPLGSRDGIDGDALLTVALEVDEAELTPYELEGMLWDTRLWVVPSELVNARGAVRITEVDPRSSWFHHAIDDEHEPHGDTDDDSSHPA